MAANPKTVYLLDTTVILHLVRGRELGKRLAERYGLSDLVYRPLVSAVSHGELAAIADRNGWGAEKRKALETALNNVVTLDLYDKAIIAGYAEVDRRSRANPGGARTLSDNDKWIAATARAAGAVLLTTDQDFLHLHPDCCAVEYEDPKP